MARAFLILPPDPDDPTQPRLPDAVASRLDGAVQIGPDDLFTPALPNQRLWDVLAGPGVLLAIKTYMDDHNQSARFVGTKWSDLRDKPWAARVFRKLVRRVVNGETVRLVVSQDDATEGDVTEESEVKPSAWFGVNDGED